MNKIFLAKYKILQMQILPALSPCKFFLPSQFKGKIWEMGGH